MKKLIAIVVSMDLLLVLGLFYAINFAANHDEGIVWIMYTIFFGMLAVLSVHFYAFGALKKLCIHKSHATPVV